MAKLSKYLYISVRFYRMESGGGGWKKTQDCNFGGRDKKFMSNFGSEAVPLNTEKER